MAQCMHPSSPTQSDVSNSDRRKIYLSQQQKHLLNQSKQSNDKCIATPGSVCDPIKSLINGWPDFSTSTMKENLKKRKCDSIPTLKVEEGKCNKRVKEDDNKIRNEDESEKCEKVTKGKNKKESENSNSTVTPKQDYIHVRARRGQATDSHSLAERVRRERISERMRHLQELVPGCNKVTGKAGMLDEIINYVQSLQRQVEFLSMKLASVNPMVEIDIEDLLHRQMNLPNDQLNASFLQFNPCFGIEMANMEQPNGSNLTPIFNGSMPDQLVDPFLNVNGSDPNWEAGLQNLYGSDLNLVKNLGFSFQ